MWSSTVEFSGENPPELRDRLLEEITEKEQWIVEGVYYKWLASSFEAADVIIYLDPKPYKRAIRIIMRFFKQRTGLERANYKQTLSGLLEMLRWNNKFDKENKMKILELLEIHKHKLIVLKSNEEIRDYDLSVIKLQKP